MDAYNKRVIGRWSIEFVGALALYILTVIAVAFFLRDHPDSPARMFLFLAPVVPTGLIVWVGYRALKRMDELQRKASLEIIALAAFATGLLTFAYGFLELAGLPRLSMFVVWPVMGLIQTLLGLTMRWWYFR